MISREEVAEKLRQAGERLRGSCCSGAAVFVTVKDIIGISKVINRKAFFDRLANLIDPTCEVALDEELSQELQGDMFRCNKCDAAFPRINGEYRYCPNCGARVVSDEA